ncbi:MAG TPA: tripartite tricarboxylate transporter substrate binding protein [Burkholderiales bacterium]|nr:tripartite tricarboxylate transporter substrate binding protein [Burkholderiales bacterium]
MNRNRAVRYVAHFAAFAFLCACTFAQAAAWSPEQNVEIIVPTSPGSGSDSTARLIQKLLRSARLLDGSSTVVNKPGGGGAVGLAYLTQHAGSGHHLFVTSPSLLTNQIVGRATIGYADLTPLAQLGTASVAFTVRADSPLRSGKDLAQKLHNDPAALTFALANALGNHNHIAIAELARAVGIDPRKAKVVVFNSSGEVVTSLLGGHTDVIASPVSSIVEHVKAGRVRVLGVCAERRLGGVLASVPTLSEQGYPVVAANWRSIVGPQGMTPAQVEYWDRVFARIAAEDEWKREIAAAVEEDTYLDSAGTRRYMEQQYRALTGILRALGLAK